MVRLFFACNRLVVWSLILLALLLGGLRLSVYALDSWRAPIIAWLSDSLQQPVEIQRLQGAWHGWTPVLRMEGVTLKADEDDQPLNLQGMWVELDLWKLLSERKLDFGEIGLKGLDLLLERDVNGQWRLAGFAAGDGDSAKPLEDRPAWLEAVRRVALTDGRLRWRDEKGGIHELLTGFELHLNRNDDGQSLFGNADMPGDGAAGGDLVWRFDWKGALEQPDQWNGHFWVQARGTDLTQLADFLPAQLQVKNGRSDLQLWAELEQGAPVRLAGRTEGRDIELLYKQKQDTHEVLARRIAADWAWQKNTQGWRLALTPVSWEIGLGRMDGQTLLLERRLEQQEEAWSLNYNGAAVGELLQAAKSIFPGEWQKQAVSAQPAGELRDVRIDWPDQKDLPQWSAHLRDVQLSNTGDIPGISPLNISMTGRDESVIAAVRGQSLLVDMPSVFPQSLALPWVDGVARWQQQQGSWNLDVSRLSVIAPDVAADIHLGLKASAGDAAPHMDLLVNTGPMVLTTVKNYLPKNSMDPDLYKWLEPAFLDGRANSGQVLFSGDLSKYPYGQGNGVMDVWADLTEVDLHYGPGWPQVNDIDADFWMRNDLIAVDEKRGNIMGNTLHDVRARIPKLGKGGLNITGRAVGPAGNALKFLRTSPLKKTHAPMVAGMDVKGRSELSLDLLVALYSGLQEDRVAGKIRLRDAKVEHQGLGLELEKVNGVLAFDDDGVLVKGMQAEVMGQPTRLAVKTEKRGKKPWVNIHADGRFLPEALNQHLQSPWLNRLKGSSRWQADLSFAAGPDGLSQGVPVKVTSDLKGLAIDMPEPIGKTAEQLRPASLQAKFQPGAETQDISLQYASLASAVMRLAVNDGQQPLRSLALVTGGKKAEMPERDGFYLSGRLQRFVVDDWLALVPEGAEADSSTRSAMSLDLQIDRLESSALTLDEATLAGTADGEWLSLEFDSRQLQGRLNYPVAEVRQRQALLELDYLYLPEADEEAETEESSTDVDPRELPAMRVSIDDFRQGEQRFGRIFLEAQTISSGLNFTTANLSNNDFRITGGGRWVREGEGNRSFFFANLQADELSGFLTRMKVDTAIQGAQTAVQASVNWPGSPWEPDLSALQGSLSMDIGDGRLLEVEPGVGRVIGVLSFETLLRRLTLDFRDLFSKGTVFDTITGDFRFENGVARSRNLSIESPVSDILITGGVGLVEENYQQVAEVTPKLSSNLPVAGALAGGPIGFGAAYLAQELFGETVDSVAKLRYAISGPWDAPEVERLVGDIE